jgi:spore coat polysaccharide biosynthesis protein SpsF (cytidylyltransferase family)
MNVAYLQCDLRFNPFLLNKIGDKTLIEATIEKVYMLRNVGKIITGIYSCIENEELIKLLETNDRIITYESKYENVTERFLEIALNCNADYIIRIGSDQCLLDIETTDKIMDEMQKEEFDWFYICENSGILPDIVKLSCLRKFEKEARKEVRYFNAFLKLPNHVIKRYQANIEPFPMNLRANNVLRFNVCKTMVENNISLNTLKSNIYSRLFSDDNYLVSTGILNSWIFNAKYNIPFQEMSGDFNPWLTMSTIEFIKERITKEMDIFEWGSGYSTLFWSKYTRSVTSCEHNKLWYDKVSALIYTNTKLLYRELEYGGTYSKAILENDNKYDIILIDGRDRVNCATSAVQRLKHGGIIIWDDSERERYFEGFDFLKNMGFKKICFKGIVYGVPKGGSTAIFYRSNNIFGI